MYSFCRCFRGQPGKNTSSQDPPLDESKEKRLRLPSPKAFGGRHVGGWVVWRLAFGVWRLLFVVCCLLFGVRRLAVGGRDEPPRPLHSPPLTAHLPLYGSRFS